ncbi:iron chaperone [Hamadaea tsunoensis]|uniref:iron chaperone n=1 Tax=Hamadaea tsunoensis TaxID=53368 RepID=UPI0003F6BEAB|nr:DUF1801 domain-containing protein [Hamadaea tsunoensis]
MATTVDEYLAGFPDATRTVLAAVRKSMHDAVPGAEEKISYGIPALTVDGRALAYFAGWKQHVSVYPVPAGDAAFQAEIEPYKAAKGTLRFPLSKPVPYALIGRVAALLAAER